MSINFALFIIILLIFFTLILIKNDLKAKFNELKTGIDILENKLDDISKK